MERPRIPPAVRALVIIALATSVLGAGLAWFGFVNFLRAEQPLTITACTPSSYTTPAAGQPGPSQPDCDHWFAAPNDQHPASQPVKVTGQVCLDTDQEVAYMVDVSWWSVSSEGGQINALSVPVTWQPGCNEPYEFDYTFPVQVLDSEPGQSLGKWKLVGKATPLLEGRWEPYQWDVTHAVEMIDS